MAEEIRAYKPRCCKKAYLHKSSAVRHEKYCFCNPDNKACLSCGNFITDFHTVYVPPHGDQNYGDADYEEKYNYCDYNDKTFGHRPGEQEWTRDCIHWIPKVGD
jgi:hypothetical protein